MPSSLAGMKDDPRIHAILDRMRELERRVAELEALTGVYAAIKGNGCARCNGLGVRVYESHGDAQIDGCGACYEVRNG